MQMRTHGDQHSEWNDKVMDWGDRMPSSQRSEHGKLNKMMTISASEAQGLAGWVLNLVRGWRCQDNVQRKQLQLIETLPLGGKRQLMLVTCDGESFLVGGGLESVETIVRLRSEVSPSEAAKELDRVCQ
jgi:Flagellar biosynthesis protein, FliO